MFTKPSRAIAAWSRADLLACPGCALLGLVLAIEPHLTTWVSGGTLEFVADGDDILYLAVSRVPYHGGWSLHDPFCTPDQRVPTLYAWLQFVPMAKLARMLGLSNVLTALLWRAFGGLLLGISVYALFRKLLGGTRRPMAWALGCAVICLVDPGFVAGRPLIRAIELPLEMARQAGPPVRGRGIPLYRVVTPLLNLPWLLLLVAVLAPGGRRSRLTWAFGSICLGLCFQLYFFFWTAALLAIGAYLGARGLAWILGHARDDDSRGEFRFGAAVLAGGMVLGAPQVFDNARTFADPQYRPILQRMLRGQRLPPGDPHRTMYLKNVWVWAELAAGAAAIAGLGLSGLGLPWFMLLSGYLLMTSAAVTGLEFENFHWAYVAAPFGEILLLAAAALVLDGIGPSKWRYGLWLLPISMAAIALAWWPFETLNNRDQVANGRLLRELEPLRPALASLPTDEALAGPGEANLALLFTRAGQLYQYDQTWYSTPIPTAEVGLRFALDAWLQGMDMPRFREAMRGREPVEKFGMGEAWAADFRKVLDGGADELLRRFRVGALLLPADAPAPERGGPWRVEARAPRWTLWRRDTAPRPPGPP